MLKGTKRGETLREKLKKGTERENALKKLVRRTVRGERNVGKLKIEDGEGETEGRIE